MNGGAELLLGGVVAVAVLWVAAKAMINGRVRRRRAEAIAEIARAGTSPVSLVGRVLWTTALIVATQWVVITKVTDRWALLVVLGVPALVAATAVVRALTVTAHNADSPRTRGRR